MAIPEDLSDRQRQAIADSTLALLPNTSAGITQPAMVVMNPDGTFVGSGGGGTITANQGTANTPSNAWPIKVTDSAGVNEASVSASGAIKVDGSAVTQPISAASLPLPAGASTSANQTTANTTLSSIQANQTNGTQVTTISGTVPVSGTVTVTQATGTNLHAVLDTGSTTAVTQATAANLNATVVQATGTNLHVNVDNFPATQPVSGTVAATQSGTWTVQPGNTANTTPWLTTINQGGNSASVTGANALKVDGSAVTQPVSAASLPLPTGAATSANQSTANTSLSSILANQTNGTQTVTGTGTAGTPASGVLSIQGISGGTPSAVYQTTDAINNGATSLTPQFAVITASASGATTIVAATASKRIRVLKWDLVANAAVNVKWQSHVTPTDLTGLYYFATNGGIESGYCPLGHFQTVAGEALDINLSGATAVGGSLVYVLV